MNALKETHQSHALDVLNEALTQHEMSGICYAADGNVPFLICSYPHKCTADSMAVIRVYFRGTQTFIAPVHVHYFNVHWGPQAIYTESKKTAPTYFSHIFVKPSSILIIFGVCIP